VLALLEWQSSTHPSPKVKHENIVVAPCGGQYTVLDPIEPNGPFVNCNNLAHTKECIFNYIFQFQSSPVSNGFFGSLAWACRGIPRADLRPASAGTHLLLRC
jgi:hypothetical protein